MDTNTIASNFSDFLYFYKSSFPNSIFHNSNVYHRDIQFVLTRYIQKKENKTLPVAISEKMSFQIEAEFEKKGIFQKLSNTTWILNYPNFIKPKVEKTK